MFLVVYIVCSYIQNFGTLYEKILTNYVTTSYPAAWRDVLISNFISDLIDFGLVSDTVFQKLNRKNPETMLLGLLSPQKVKSASFLVDWSLLKLWNYGRWNL